MIISDAVKEIYRTPEVLKSMPLYKVQEAKVEIEKIIAAHDANVKTLAKAWEDDFNAHSNGNDWYWSMAFERYNQAELNKGVWDAIMTCVESRLAGNL